MSKLSTSNDYRILTGNYGDLCIYPIGANTDDLEISITSGTKDLCLSVAIRIFDSICGGSNNRYTHEAIKILRASIDSNKNKLKTRPFIRNATINLEEGGLTVNYDEIKKIIELQLYQLLDLNPGYNTSCKKASIKFSLDKTKCSDSDEIIIHTSRAVFRALVNLQYAIKKDSKK